MFLIEVVGPTIDSAWLSLLLGPFGALVLAVWVGHERKKEIKRLQEEQAKMHKNHEEFVIAQLTEKNEILEKQRQAAEKTREALTEFSRTLEAVSKYMETSNGSMGQITADLETLKLQWAHFQGREEGRGQNSSGPGDSSPGPGN